MDPLAVAKGAVNIVAGPALNASKEWVGYVATCKDNVEKLKTAHHDLNNLRKEIRHKVELGEMINQEAVPQVKEWIEGVDKFMDVDSKEEWEELLMDEEARRKAESCCFGIGWNPKFRHDLSKKAEDKGKIINERIEKMSKRGLDQVTLDSKPLKLTNLSSFYCKGLTTRDQKLKDIMESLRDDKVNRVGIYGMGGSGKTTLVEELVRRCENEKLFNAIVIAKISRNPDYKNIQEQIADRIGFSTLDRYHSVEERAMNLGNRLKRIKNGQRLNVDDEQHGATKTAKPEDEKDGEKKVLNKMQSRKDQTKVGKSEPKEKKPLEDEKQGKVEKSGKLLVILDNVWKKLEFQQMGIIYELEKDLGCKIILTSRSKDVCKSMDATDAHIFKIDDLDENEAIVLFKQRVGTIVDSEDFKEVCVELLKKCSRLPLSINLLADTLKNQTLSVWKRILKQLDNPVQGETVGVLGETYSIIEMSYKYLGNEEKQMFFLLCCLFPPGSSVRIDDLIRYGIGLDLFQYVDSIVEAIDQAYEWANDLKSVSLAAEVNIKAGVITMHDDVREAGKSFAAKGKYAFHVGAIPKWLKKRSYQKYKVISMMSSNTYKYLAGQNLPHLQLLRSLGMDCSKLSITYFSGMENLKVLDMSWSDIETFPTSFECLKNLETLLLEHCLLKDISQISKLVKLQVLSFRESNITTLPQAMRALEELKLLDLTNCHMLKEIPSGIFSGLTQLEGLYMKGSFSNWATTGNTTSLSELTSLPLQVLEVEIQRTSQLVDGDLPVLQLSSYKVDLAVETPPQQDTSIFSKALQIAGVHVDDIRKEGWKSLMNKAESIFVKDIQGLENMSPTLSDNGWKDLKRATISKCMMMKHLISRKAMYQSDVFPKLEMLKLENLLFLEGLYHGKPPPGLFSNLQELALLKLYRLESSDIAIQHATRLKVLEVKDCSNLVSIFSAPIVIPLSEHEEAKSNSVIQFPCLEKLILGNLDSLQGLFLEAGAKNEEQSLFPKQVIFPRLEKMKLKRLDKIKHLWDVTTEQEFMKTFPKLRSISLKYLKIEHVWRSNSTELQKTRIKFEKLKKLKIFSCDLLKTVVCSPTIAIGLHQLQLLRIRYCGVLEQFISTEEGSGISSSSSKQPILKFTNLLTLDLQELSELVYFYKGSMKVEFPTIKKLMLDTLPNLSALIKVEPRKSTKTDRKIKDNLKYDGILFREIKLPFLEQIYLEKLDNIEFLWDMKIQQFFTTFFPALLSLSLRGMKKIRYLWSDQQLSDSAATVHLKDIEIEDCESLESLFEPSTKINKGNTELLVVEFPKLQTIKVESSQMFRCILQGSNISLKLPVVTKIELRSLEKMVAILLHQLKESPSETSSRVGEDTEKEENKDRDPLEPLINKKVLMPFLDELQLEGLDSVNKLWEITSCDEFAAMFPCLQTLEIGSLPKLKHVWSDELKEESIVFGILEYISVCSCEEMESLFILPVVGDGSAGESQHKKVNIITFPRLQTLILNDLQSFRCLFPAKCSNMEFQALRVLMVKNLPLVETLVRLRKYYETRTIKKKESDTEQEDSSSKESGDGSDESNNEDGDNQDDELEMEDGDNQDDESNKEDDKDRNDKSDKEDGDDHNDESNREDGDDQSQEQDTKKDEVEKDELVREDDFRVNDPILFQGNVDFSSLEELKIKYMDNLERLCEDERSIEVENVDVVDVCNFVFPKIKKLHLNGGDGIKMKQILLLLLHKLQSLTIKNFDEIKYLASSNIKNSPPSKEVVEEVEGEEEEKEALTKSMSEFKNLEELIVKDCDSLEGLFECDGDHVTSTFLSSLRTLSLSGLDTLTSLEWHLLPNLQKLIVKDCVVGEKDFLIPSSSIVGGLSLQSLESMEITECAGMEAIIGGEDDEKLKDDQEVIFPQLKKVNLTKMQSLCKFSSIRGGSILLPSLVSMEFEGCGIITSFSLSPVVAPNITTLQVNEKPVTIVGGDINIALQQYFELNSTITKYWPRKLKSKLHEEHPLSLMNFLGRECDNCEDWGMEYSYSCVECDFDLDLDCALDVDQLDEVPDELKVGEDWPKILTHRHKPEDDEHDMDLCVAGREYYCAECRQLGELYAYFCQECDDEFHPRCVLQASSSENQS